MSQQGLNAEELFHLAVHDAGQGNHEGAIEKLKRALTIDDRDARYHFMLAAEHAQIRMSAQAMEGMQAALRLDPNLHVARLQLGLLQFFSQDFEAARQTWAGLDVLGPSNSMVLFKEAYLHCVAGEARAALHSLEQGIKAETQNAALRESMVQLAEQLKHIVDKNLSVTAPEVAKATAVEATELLSRYGVESPTPKKDRKH